MMMLKHDKTTEQPAKSNKDASNILKGIAILTVLINHYLNRYTTLESGGFANTVVAIFFLLSGYGIFISFKKRATDIDEVLSFKSIVTFYISRFARIFPLFWMALAIEAIIENSFQPTLFSFLGFEAGRHYWFVSSILQCYLLTPFLIFLIEKNKFWSLVIVTCGFGILTVLSTQSSILESVLGFFHLAKQPYLGTYFLHTYLFFLGMCVRAFGLASSQSEIETNIARKWHYIVFLCLIGMTFLYIFLEKFVLDVPLLIGLLLLIIASVYAMRNMISRDFFVFDFLAFLGIHSFSIYLLHMSYYIFLEKVGLLKPEAIIGLLILIALFPIFMIAALKLEKIANYISKKLTHFSLILIEQNIYHQN